MTIIFRSANDNSTNMTKRIKYIIGILVIFLEESIKIFHCFLYQSKNNRVIFLNIILTTKEWALLLIIKEYI